MKVEIWSDFACPFCYIGKRRFENALKKFEHSGEVETVFKSYQLDPYAPNEIDKDIYSILSEKQGVSYQEAKGFTVQIAQQANELGLDYQFDTMILTNTFAAHRLSHFANLHGKMYEMIERVLKGFFSESLNISDYDVLATLAEEIGLDKQEALTVLSQGKYSENVQRDMEEAQKIGVRGVPFFVFNQKYAVSGAQPSEAFLEVLQKVWDDENKQPLTMLKSTEGDNCEDGSCKF